MENILRKFLEDRYIHVFFENNLFAQNKNLYESIEDFTNLVGHHNAILLAFDWKKSPEEYTFWYRVNKDWKEYLKWLKCF